MEYKDTIFLPKTNFEMRANLPNKEPKILAEWNEKNIYKKLRAFNGTLIRKALELEGKLDSLLKN